VAITFDVTVGSRLNCCIIFWKPFSLGLLWNQYSVTRRYGFRSDRWIALKCLHEFPEAVFLWVDMESQLDDEDVSSARLE
jgi:hypothetical protein